jgi:hypothetical protein
MIIDMDQFGELLAAWDDLSRACENVETALPQRMSEAIGELESSRQTFHTLIIKVGRGAR